MSRLSDVCVPSFALAVCLVGCAAATPADPSTVLEGTAGGQRVALSDPRAIQLVAEGAELARSGQCGRAIVEALEPALVIFERRHGRNEHPPVASRVDTERLGPEWSDAMYLQAFCLVDTGRNEEAVELLERALATIPNDVVYACELGHIRQLEGAFEEALGVYQRGLDNVAMLRREGLAGALLFGQTLDWWARRSLRGLGFSLVELGRLEDAELIYRRVLELDPGDARAIRELQLIATRQGAI